MQPKLPICYFDARTGILCGNCESRLRKGEISRADVEASKAVAHLADRIPELGHVTLRRAFEASGSYVLEFDKGDMIGLRSNPLLQSELEGALKGKVWLVGAGASKVDLEQFVNQTATVTLSGATQATVDTRQHLDFSVSGASQFYFLSNPVTGKMEVLGAATVKHKS